LLADDEVGREAARRTVAKLGARKVDTQECPVVFDPDVGRSILGLLAGCINGGAIWRRSSYLVDREGDRIASELVNVVDDPLIPSAPGSRPFDGEGLLSRRNAIVEKGVLKTYLLDTYSARKLGKESTASASRGSSGGVSAATTNFVLQPGELDAEELVRSTKRGLYVTEMMGFGFNAVTGDFSRGAGGFWIENGEKTFPVSEVTISLNLDELLPRDALARGPHEVGVEQLDDGRVALGLGAVGVRGGAAGGGERRQIAPPLMHPARRPRTERPTSASNTTGTSCVSTFCAPSFASVRRAASRPTSSSGSRPLMCRRAVQ
jgi:hypothetical protein